MSADHARELRLQLNDARALAAALGLQTAPRATARQALVLCPFHGEHTPSCSVRLAKDSTISVRCHGCGATGDALSLIAVTTGPLGSHFQQDHRDPGSVGEAVGPQEIRR